MRYFIPILFFVMLFSCKEKSNTEQVKKDSTTGVPEKLPEAKEDERFLSIFRDLPEPRFYVYASDLQAHFTAKMLPAIENGTAIKGLLATEQVDILGLPESQFGEKNIVWIKNQMQEKEYIVLLIGSSPKDYLQDDLNYYLVTFTQTGRYIDHILLASFQEKSPSLDTKSYSYWNRYEIKTHIDKTEYNHVEETKRFTQEIIEYGINSKGIFEKNTKKLKRNYTDKNNLDLDDNTIDVFYEYFPFKAEGFETTNPKLKIKEDKENGLMSLENTKTSEKVVFTYFKDHANGKTFAHQYSTDKSDGESKYETYFFVYGNATWTDVTEDILPPISLKDFFGTEENLPPVKYRKFFTMSYELPQEGTTMRVVLRELSTIDRGIDLEDFERYTKKIRYQTIEINWNMDEGKFEVGKKY
jgi:hypothetical protein